MRIGRRPLTPLEAGVYVSLVAIFVTVFATRMLSYMEAAERAMMEVTVTRLMSAGSVRRAYGVLRGQADDATAWTKRNPFELAGFPPPNFSGEIDPLQPKPLERGSWAFDPARGELIYLPRRAAHSVQGAAVVGWGLRRGDCLFRGHSHRANVMGGDIRVVTLAGLVKPLLG